MSSAIEKYDRVKALAITILFHVLLFLFFIYFIIHTPLPPFPETAGTPGIEVNFGNLTEGTGNTENSGIGDMPENQNNTAVTEKTTTSASENVLTNDAEETANINKSENKKKTDTKTEDKKVDKPVDPQPSQALADALSKFKSNKNKSTGGDGNSGKAGNEGDPNGSPDGTGNGGDGTGNGSGVKYDLKGRVMLKRPDISDDSQEEGRVVVDIIVDESGRVTHATPGARGSTTTSAVLYAKARQAALTAKFNTAAQGIKEQRGSITFVFILD